MGLEEELTQETPLILLGFHKLVKFCHYSAIVLGTAEKQFAIYTHILASQSFQSPDPFQSSVLERPLTHELLGFVLAGFDLHVSQVVIHQCTDNVFCSRIFLEQKQEGFSRIVDVDSRPSDSIPLALAYKAPIFCVKSVFDATVPFEGALGGAV